MKRNFKIRTDEKGFTLVEILAVLVILGVMAALAIPQYIDLADQSKQSAAQAQVAEMKSTMNLAYAKVFFNEGRAPQNVESVVEAAGFELGVDAGVGTAPDIWSVTFQAGGAPNSLSIRINSRGAQPPDTGYRAIGTWRMPN